MRNKLYIKYLIQILVGILFLVSGIMKALDSKSFSMLFSSYGFDWAGFLAPVISSVEIILGLCLILNILIKTISLLVTLITFLFLVIYLYAYFFRGVVDCGCMGTLIKLPPYVTISRNIVIIILCTWVWLYSNNSEKVQNWKKAVLYFTGGVFMIIAGYTMEKPLLTNDNEKIHVGDQVNLTFLNFINDKISKDTSMVFIFRPECEHCWNATENMKNIQRTTRYNVIGLTYNDSDTSDYMVEMKPNFEVIKYPSDELYNYIVGVPVLLILKNGKVIRIVDSPDIPCGPVLRKMLY